MNLQEIMGLGETIALVDKFVEQGEALLHDVGAAPTPPSDDKTPPTE